MDQDLPDESNSKPNFVMPMPVSSPMKMNTEMELGVRCERLELRVPVVYDAAELSDMTKERNE